MSMDAELRMWGAFVRSDLFHSGAPSPNAMCAEWARSYRPQNPRDDEPPPPPPDEERCIAISAAIMRLADQDMPAASIIRAGYRDLMMVHQRDLARAVRKLEQMIG